MTSEAIDAMVAGPELDALVHAALGYKWDESRCRVCGWPVVPEGEDGCWQSNCSMRPIPKRRADHNAPPYSSSLPLAWLIIDRLAPNHHWAVISQTGPELLPERWGVMAEFCRFREMQIHRAEAKTAAEAICKAALKCTAATA